MDLSGYYPLYLDPSAANADSGVGTNHPHVFNFKGNTLKLYMPNQPISTGGVLYHGGGEVVGGPVYVRS